MRYSIGNKDQIYFKCYKFIFFAESTDKTFSSKYGQEFLDTTKMSATGALKTASKRAL